MAVTSNDGVLEYDEEHIGARLTAMSRAQRALFACANAERLMPAYRWYCEQTGCSDVEAVRLALDAAWSAAGSGSPMPAADITHLREDVEARVPDADDDLAPPGGAVAQNAVACVAYSLQASESDEARPAVWSARQLYEAADSVVQQRAPGGTYIDDIEREPPVRLLLQGIAATLDHVLTVDDSHLRAEAEADGHKFLAYVVEAADRLAS